MKTDLNNQFEMSPEARVSVLAAYEGKDESKVVYIKTVDPTEIEGLPEGVALYSVHLADGTRVAVMPSREAAIVAARQEDMVPLSVH